MFNMREKSTGNVTFSISDFFRWRGITPSALRRCTCLSSLERPRACQPCLRIGLPLQCVLRTGGEAAFVDFCCCSVKNCLLHPNLTGFLQAWAMLCQRVFLLVLGLIVPWGSRTGAQGLALRWEAGEEGRPRVQPGAVGEGVE
jgi:hypothetical protein